MSTTILISALGKEIIRVEGVAAERMARIAAQTPLGTTSGRIRPSGALSVYLLSVMRVKTRN